MNNKPKLSSGGRAAYPQYGKDYVYGKAIIVASKRQSGGDFITSGDDGWYLPGGIWTRSQQQVKLVAVRMDAMINAGECGE